MIFLFCWIYSESDQESICKSAAGWSPLKSHRLKAKFCRANYFITRMIEILSKTPDQIIIIEQSAN